MANEGHGPESNEVTDELAMLEAVRIIKCGKSVDYSCMSAELRTRVRGLLMEAANRMPLVLPEPAPEAMESLIQALKSRFNAHPERHKGVEWGRVEKALRADPEKLVSLQKLEETGGEPDVLREQVNNFIFADFSLESPMGRRNLTYGQSVDQARAFGVMLITDTYYNYLQQCSGKVDEQSFSFLRSEGKLVKLGRALIGTSFHGLGIAPGSPSGNEKTGWRAMLKVPKANR